MNFSTLKHEEYPPVKAGLRSGLEFIEMMRSFTDKEKLRRQKDFEKRVNRPFNIRGWESNNSDR